MIVMGRAIQAGHAIETEIERQMETMREDKGLQNLCVGKERGGKYRL